jgi:hypothetical protein
MEQGGAKGPPATDWVSHLAHLVPSKAPGTERSSAPEKAGRVHVVGELV